MTSNATSGKPPRPADRQSKIAAPASRTQDPEGVKRDILAVATTELSANGFSGARVDEIAARTQTSKRMIYYYFGSKKGLYLAVLESAYRGIREIEGALKLDTLEPELAMRALVGYTFDYQTTHPEFVRLVMIENIHGAANLRGSNAIQGLNVSIITTLQNIIDRGQLAGKFRGPLSPIDLHMTMSALSFFHVSNQATFSAIFDVDMATLQALAIRRAQVIDVIMRYVSMP